MQHGDFIACVWRYANEGKLLDNVNDVRKHYMGKEREIYSGERIRNTNCENNLENNENYTLIK